MAFAITNQKPAVLSPVYSLPVTGEFNPVPAITSTVVDPMFVPINSGMPVTITGPKNTAYDESMITDILLTALGPQVEPDAEDAMRDLLHQTLIHYDHTSPLLANELFAVQAGAQNKMPAPTATCIYAPNTDIIPAAKKYIGGGVDGSELFASIAFTFHPNTLGFCFASSTAFDEFKNWLQSQVAVIQPNLPGDTVNMLNQFHQLNLKGLTEALSLRVDDSDNNHDYSFARVIVYYLMAYAGTAPADQFNVMPFTLGELYAPRSIVMVNAEAHARSLPGRITKEWTLINKSISSPVKVVSNKQLSLSLIHI